MKTTALAGLAAALLAGGTFVATLSAAAQSPTTTTLAEAAAQPHGIGREHELAKDVKGTKGKQVKPEDVFKTSSSKRGGCVPVYSTGGQCLPTVPPSQAEHVAAGHMKPTWTCPEVRTVFARGIVLERGSADPLRLDRDQDGVACGPGD